MTAKQSLPGRKRKADSISRHDRSPLKSVTPGQQCKRLKDGTNPKLGQSFLTFSNKPLHTTCNRCSMQYNTVSVEDSQLHAKFCSSNDGPIQWSNHGKHDEDWKLGEPAILKQGGKRIESWILVSQYSEASKALQGKLDEVASRMDASLSAIPISRQDIEKSTFYLCLKSRTGSISRSYELVGAAITRPIASAYRVISGATQARECQDGSDSPDLLRFGENETALFCAPKPVPAKIGIDRIWTADTMRHCGIASMLLDTIASRAIYGTPVTQGERQDLFAFSQPTSAGARLFARWTETQAFMIFT